MIIHLFYLVLSVVRDAHKFYFSLIDSTPNKWQQLRRRSCSDKETHVFDKMCIYFPRQC